MNGKFWVKAPEVKTIDSIVKQFDTMIADLHNVAVEHKNDEDNQAAIIANATAKMNVATQEHARALGIADKIQALIS